MSTINTILIKRRSKSSGLNTIPTLSSGELAYNEKTNILYYGSESGTINIAGSGAYVDVSSTQTVSGPKTFTGTTTISGLTVSSGSTIDFGSNTITNVADPVNAQDVATKQYVLDQTSGNFVEKVEDEAVTLSGGLTVSGGLDSDTVTTTGDVQVGGDLIVVGDLQVQGDVTSINTTTTVTSAFSINNAGTTTALTVEQSGPTDIAEFIDDGSTALIIKNGGNVGIGTATPNENLTVVGNISAQGGLISSELEVNGQTTLNGSLGVSSSATLSATLTVDGATTLNDTLTVNSVANVTDTLTVGGITNLNGQVTVDNTLSVTNGTTLNDTLTVVGTASLDNGSITTDGNGSITGTAGTSELINFVIDGGTF